MKPPKPSIGRARLAKALKKLGDETYMLSLYISGITPRSITAIERIKRICEQHLRGRYQLDVIDIYQQPTLAMEKQIIAAPTLIKNSPLPLRRIIGDMANENRVLSGLDLRPRM